MKYVAIPFDNATGSVRYKQIVLQPFDLNFLFDLETADNIIFYGWEGMQMAGEWYKVENYEDKIILEFYSTHYHIIKKKAKHIKYCFPYPRTLNEFMLDCTRCDVDLWWNENALIKYKPSIVMTETDIDAYYRDILTKIGKS